MTARARALLLLGAVCTLLSGCDSCAKKSEKAKDERTPKRSEQCISASDCADDNPCTGEICSDGRCVTSFVPQGQSCDNETVCDGVAECDGKGRCRAGPPPAIDDGNPCTHDACDSVTGVTHQPVAVDDGDDCTRDACNPVNGEITHDPADVDDGDDCTLDTCDPKHGPKHERPNAFYTCDASCGAGFHVASRAARGACGSTGALQNFCVPSCGASYYQCESGCADGYHSTSRTASTQCGQGSELQTFCEKNGADAFYTCDAACPSGHRQEPGSPAAHCGGTGGSIRCVKTGP
jgi:Dictyostelium (slime mold) repeat